MSSSSLHDERITDTAHTKRNANTLTDLVDYELHADAKLRMEMSHAVAPYKPLLNGSGQSYCIRQVYFRFQCHGTTIDERSLVLQGRSARRNRFWLQSTATFECHWRYWSEYIPTLSVSLRFWLQSTDTLRFIVAGDCNQPLLFSVVMAIDCNQWLLLRAIECLDLSFFVHKM